MDLQEKVSGLIEELDALKKDYYNIKNTVLSWESKLFEIRGTLLLVGILVGFSVVGALLKLLIREWPTFLAGAIWLIGSVLVIWLVVSIITLIFKGVFRLFPFRKK